MFNFIEKQSKKIGMSPGSLTYVGKKKIEKIRITIFDYDETEYHEEETEHAEACFPFKDRKTNIWIHVKGIHEPAIIEEIGHYYDIHHLILEDVLDTIQRPKLEDYEDSLFIVLKMFYHDKDMKNIFVEQFSLVLKENTVISFQEGENDIFLSVRKRLRNDKGRMRKMGADYLAYALMDTVLDYYFAVTEIMEDRIESVEEELFSNLSQNILQNIHQLKRDIIFMKKAAIPMRELIGNLEKNDSPLIRDATQIYLRDLYDHAIQIVDTVEIFREITTGLLDIYHSGVSNRMNEIMKVLTVIATIFIPLTFIAGIYGMNFRYMPELEWKWGYPLFWVIIIIIALFMIIRFKKNNWL